MLPGIVWSIISTLMGREGERPSPESLKTMEAGWATFFKACGVEYIGEGLNLKLRSSFWLLLVPVVATLTAIVSEFNLASLLIPKTEHRKPEQTTEPVL